MSDDIIRLRPIPGRGADYRDLGPQRVCPCGSEWFNVICKFDEDYEIGIYFTDAKCVECDSIVKIVTEIDKDNQ